MESNPDYAHWCHSYPKRLEIPLHAPAHTKIEAKLLADVKIELPGINYLHNGKHIMLLIINLMNWSSLLNILVF